MSRADAGAGEGSDELTQLRGATLLYRSEPQEECFINTGNIPLAARNCSK